MTAPYAIEAVGVSKKFARTSAAAMRYGLRDTARDFLGLPGRRGRLRRAEFWSLDDVSFSVGKGECVALLGPNGAGKSTMLKLFNGIYLPDRGKITMRGRLGALIELGAGFHPMLSGRENIYINGMLLGLTRRQIAERFDEIVAFAGVEDFLDTAVRFYSSGMYVRLGFSIATQVQPDILLIDEVLAVGDAGFRLKCFKHLMDMAERGASIVIVSHSPAALARVCNRAIVFDRGKMCFDGDLHAGVGVYHHLLHVDTPGAKEPSAEAVHPELASIASVTAVDASGTPRGVFETGDDVYFDICLHASQRIERARLVVAIVSPSHGNLASISSPYKEFWFDLEPPQTTIRFCLENIPLLIGGYRLNVSLCGPNVEDFYDRQRGTGAFRITGPPIDTNGYGQCEAVQLAHHWERIE